MKLVMLFVQFLVVYSQLYAQEIHLDSSEIKRKLAFADAKHFKPTKQIRKAYRQHILSNTSDYFNPTIQNISNAGFLKDSLYVKSFKNASYIVSVKKIKSKRTIIVCSIIAAGVIALPILVEKGLKSLLADAHPTI